MLKEFKNPSAAYRGKPFWSWNGRLEEDELLRQIDVIKDMGFGGYFMHSRTGLQTEYLGDEWFDLINACADYGDELGMESWLYDEDRWPSGLAGGIVTEDRPDLWMKALHLEVLDATEPIPQDGLASFYATVADDISLMDYVPATKGKQASHNKLLVFRQINSELHPVYNGTAYIDTMKKEAVQRFLEVTHEKHVEKCGDRLGTSITGIFTDEPHRGTLMDVFGSSNAGDKYRIPWTEAIPAEFEEKFGYSLVDKLPEIYFKPDGNPVSPTKLHYVELCQQLFLDNFMKPMDEWCRDHNLILTGHLLHEDSLTAQTVMNGSMIRNYEYMEYPGIDILSGYNECYWVAKQLQSAGRQLDRPWLMSEMYGCSGWQMKLEDYKRSGDWQALFGINLRCPHLSWYTMEGEGKRDYPASIFFQSNWYPEYKELEDYYARIAVVMMEGKPVCDLLVINPIESVWSQISLEYAQHLTAKAPEIEALEKNYQTLFHWLSGGQVDFDYGEEDFIDRFGSITTGEGAPLFTIGESEYTTVLVSGAVTLRESTRKALEDFAAAGGRVIFAGEKPGYVDALPAAEAYNFGIEIPFERESVLDTLAMPQIDLANPNIYVQKRIAGDKLYYMMLNMNHTEGQTVYAPFPDGEVTLLDCRTGETSVFATGEQGEATLDFAPDQEYLFMVDTSKAKVKNEQPEDYATPEALGELLEYRLDEDNVCVLDMARLQVNGGDWSQRQEILQLDRAMRDAIGLPWRSGDMLQPWYQEKHQDKLEQHQGEFVLEYDFEVEVLPESTVWLAIEHPERVAITINDHPIHALDGYWVDPCLEKVKVFPEYLVEGENIVRLTGTYRNLSEFESLYLIGAFGVRLEAAEGEKIPSAAEYGMAPGTYPIKTGVAFLGSRRILTALPEKLALGALVHQGLPFYGGRVSYRFALPEDTGKGRLTLDDFGGSCVKVHHAGGESLFLAKPYSMEIDLTGQDSVWVDTILTRRNTFGPFHLVPAVTFSYGPESFMNYLTPSYGLLNNGLAGAPMWQAKQ